MYICTHCFLLYTIESIMNMSNSFTLWRFFKQWKRLKWWCQFYQLMDDGWWLMDDGWWWSISICWIDSDFNFYNHNDDRLRCLQRMIRCDYINTVLNTHIYIYIYLHVLSSVSKILENIIENVFEPTNYIKLY